MHTGASGKIVWSSTQVHNNRRCQLKYSQKVWKRLSLVRITKSFHTFCEYFTCLESGLTRLSGAGKRVDRTHRSWQRITVKYFISINRYTATTTHYKTITNANCNFCLLGWGNKNSEHSNTLACGSCPIGWRHWRNATDINYTNLKPQKAKTSYGGRRRTFVPNQWHFVRHIRWHTHTSV